MSKRDHGQWSDALPGRHGGLVNDMDSGEQIWIVGYAARGGRMLDPRAARTPPR